MMTVREAYAIFFLETCKRAEEMDILKVRETLDAIIPYDPDADRRAHERIFSGLLKNIAEIEGERCVGVE